MWSLILGSMLRSHNFRGIVVSGHWDLACLDPLVCLASILQCIRCFRSLPTAPDPAFTSTTISQRPIPRLEGPDVVHAPASHLFLPFPLEGIGIDMHIHSITRQETDVSTQLRVVTIFGKFFNKAAVVISVVSTLIMATNQPTFSEMSNNVTSILHTYNQQCLGFTHYARTGLAVMRVLSIDELGVK